MSAMTPKLKSSLLRTKLIFSGLRTHKPHKRVQTRTLTTVFSGIQPTGSLHLGNYFGAVNLWKSLQNDPANQLIISVVDMHAITVPWKPGQLRDNITQTFIELLACDIDPRKVVLFQQSSVAEHSKLQWIFSCLSTMTRVDNLPQFKEKSAAQKEVSCGLFTYPVLQAADILLYKAQLVPVGEDQEQHLQLAQDIARIFNNKCGKLFPVPHRLHSDLPRLKSLRDPKKKMSKSDPDSRSLVQLSDAPGVIQEKLKKSVTDSRSEITYDPVERPAIANLLLLYKSVLNVSLENVLEEASTINKVILKARIAEAVIELLRPVHGRMVQLRGNMDYVEQVMIEGAGRARSLASHTMAEVEHLVGFSSKFRNGLKFQVERNDRELKTKR